MWIPRLFNFIQVFVSIALLSSLTPPTSMAQVLDGSFEPKLIISHQDSILTFDSIPLLKSTGRLTVRRSKFYTYRLNNITSLKKDRIVKFNKSNLSKDFKIQKTDSVFIPVDHSTHDQDTFIIGYYKTWEIGVGLVYNSIHSSILSQKLRAYRADFEINYSLRKSLNFSLSSGVYIWLNQPTKVDYLNKPMVYSASASYYPFAYRYLTNKKGFGVELSYNRLDLSYTFPPDSNTVINIYDFWGIEAKWRWPNFQISCGTGWATYDITTGGEGPWRHSSRNTLILSVSGQL